MRDDERARGDDPPEKTRRDLLFTGCRIKFIGFDMNTENIENTEVFFGDDSR